MGSACWRATPARWIVYNAGKLQNNGYRWYEAGTGRWLSEAPQGLGAGDVNVNRYVGNSPLNYADPSGLAAVAWSAAGSNRGGGHEPILLIEAMLKSVPNKHNWFVSPEARQFWFAVKLLPQRTLKPD